MSYSITEIAGVPAVRAVPAKKVLTIGGKDVAVAVPSTRPDYKNIPRWDLTLGDNAVSLWVKEDAVLALFNWVGELAGPPKLVTILLNEGELDLAPLGSLWTSTYNDGTYRCTLTGWEYQPPTDMFGPGFTALSSGISNHAYPLTAKK